MDDTVTHVPSPPLVYKQRMIQRCAVCGDKLLDINLNGDEVQPAHPDGELVRFKNRKSVKIMGEYERFNNVPPDFCIVLVEN